MEVYVRLELQGSDDAGIIGAGIGFGLSSELGYALDRFRSVYGCPAPTPTLTSDLFNSRLYVCRGYRPGRGKGYGRGIVSICRICDVRVYRCVIRGRGCYAV